MTAHLELMSKPRLIDIIRKQEATIHTLAAQVRAGRATSTRVANVRRENARHDPAQTTRDAQTILDNLPPDPLAQEHRDDLANAVWAGHALVKGRAHCWRAECRRPLVDGRCGRCNTDRSAAA